MAQLERQSPNSAHWSHEHYESLFTKAASELSENLILVVEDPAGPETLTGDASTPRIIAYLAARCINDDWELQYIVVEKKTHRRGVATCLLNQFIAHVRAKGGGRIFLEVRKSNTAARSLYRKLGFEETGLRRSYYSNPPEDAILCGLSLY